ncbi:hypothetical protein Dsin_004164 [Dipteronia sinensis]|uniref:Uncharacterized protein n=1 Tax=Dipteronia sinensis TaxID=43782 RepID=A0AAE0EKX7_9ROSI|nr:hypothetical protein Dsin_004164 [Dipteronia sinensis]
MSFAIIHSDIEREWENLGGVMGLFFIIGDSCSLSEDLYVCENSWEDEETKLNFKFIIALEHPGAFEQWSLCSTAHMEDCSLGLLHSFGFAIFLLSSEYILMIRGYQSR